MKDIAVIGTGDFASIVYQILRKHERNVVCFCVDDEYLSDDNTSFWNIPVIGRSELIKKYTPDTTELVAGFIGSPMFDIRQKKCDEYKALGYSFANVIDTDVSYAAQIGEGNVIMQNVSLGFDTHIGDGNIIWPGVVFPHNNYIGDYNNIAPTASLSGYAKVGSHCYIGNNAIIKNRITVNDYTFVGAGAYIRHDTVSGTTIVPPRSYELDRPDTRL